MSARLVRGWSVHGFEVWILENRSLRVVVVPELGGKVFELVDKVGDRDLLWHNRRIEPRRAPFGANFDDWWSGGWDEIFPTGDVAQLAGEPLPYMGELWSVPWEAREDPAPDGAVGMVATGPGTIAPARLERRLELRGDEPVLRVSYRLTNLDLRPLPYLWGIHPAFAISPVHRIDLLAERMLVGVSSDQSLFGAPGDTYTWPHLGTRDLSLVPLPSTLAFAGHWATELREGWVALTDTETRRGVAIAFPRDVFTSVWLWQVYGGWRGHYHLALEPWTGHPMQLEQALAAGTARHLAPGETHTAEVAFVVYGDRERVSGVDFAGEDVVVR
jgi:hypothetical protein